MKFYAGIGSRETPPRVLQRMTERAIELREQGYTLRSGAAEGADTAFEAGAGDQKEIWLPWRGFQNHPSLLVPSTAAHDLAAKFHPAWDRLSQGARKLHARNCHQVLGADLATPVEFVLCWTKDGQASGGTGQAIRIARAYRIPVEFL